MKLPNIRTLLLNSMFIRLMAGYLLIIMITSVFYLISYNFFVKNIENEIINNASHTIDYKKDKMDEKIYQMKNMLLKISSDNVFTPVINRQQTPYSQKQILTNFNETYRVSSEYILKYIRSIFVLPEDPLNNILTFDATFKTERFFNVFYNNPTYTYDFWINEMNGDFTFKFYPASTFQDHLYYSFEKVYYHTLLPMAFKQNRNSPFIMISLIDINALNEFIGDYDNFYIHNLNKELLYPSEQNTNFNTTDIDTNMQYHKTETGYLFSRSSSESGLIYSTFLPNDTLRQQLKKTNSIFRLIAVISIIFSLLLSVYLVKIFNDPVKQIADIISNSTNNNASGKALGLKKIRDSIQMIVEDNESKNSMLQTYFYQSSLKGNYSPLDEIKRQFTFNNYMLLCFVIHYKERYATEIREETGKGTFVLKELIELYLSGYFKDSITFQIESDKIISIININKDIQDISLIIKDIADKLKYEEEYVFFTIILSNLCSDTSQLHKTYDRLFEMVKYRKLLNNTQVLSEDIIKTFNNRYYLSSEQLEQFSNLLSNGHQNECREFISDILQYNYKKGVIQFSFQLLCSEIINCGIKVLAKLYYEVPTCFDATLICSGFNSFTTIDEYIRSCDNFIISVTNHINNHKKEGDHIIDYITGYIEKHYSEEIYLDLLAEKLGITNNYISTYFREKVGTNFNFYLNNFRIKKSIELLSIPSSLIKDISKEVGYANVNTFTRTFKKHMGKTPEEYRKDLI